MFDGAVVPSPAPARPDGGPGLLGAQGDLVLIGAGLALLAVLLPRLSGTIKITPGSIELNVLQLLAVAGVGLIGGGPGEDDPGAELTTSVAGAVPRLPRARDR